MFMTGASCNNKI